MVVANTLTTTVRLTEHGWRLEAAPQRESQAGQTMVEESKSDSNDAAAMPSDLDNLPIRLVFEAARLELPLGELRRLSSGSLLQIDSTPGMVRIIANGQTIGNGELVTIDGRAGVRITAFSAGADDTLPRRSAGE
jgi:type III secretion protein Q